VTDALRAELARVADAFGGEVQYTLERPRDASHGDLATNLAMQLARRDRVNPRDMAARVVAALDLPRARLASAEIAGPGFINFRLAADTLADDFGRILELADDYGRAVVLTPQRIDVEFVSANPTGPLHVGHGRGAAIGDGIAALLEWTGHTVTREFYVNDAGVQIDRLAESLWARVQQAAGRDASVPEGGYHGDYLTEAAVEWLRTSGAALAELPRADGIARCRAKALAMQRAEQDATLADFGVHFDVVTSEQQLYDSGQVAAVIALLGERGLTFEEDGALWLRSSAFGDDRDRVLRKRDGSYTYLVPDIAYHLDKRRRGFDHASDVWGADHHGYIARMQAALAALGVPPDWLAVTVVQLVRVVRHGEEVKMSKRSGDFVTLRELYEETGVDAARYWFLMRRADTHLTFDIEVAKSSTDENPVFYVQMAHARMAGILRNAGRTPDQVTGAIDVGVLSDADAVLLKKLIEFPDVVLRAAQEREPHRVTTFLDDLARLTHAWYHASRVLGEPAPVEQARLLLARGTRQVFGNALRLLGITAPDRM
jgi:arginyl-tRNA synthetase